jgi:hypothetical protein
MFQYPDPSDYWNAYNAAQAYALLWWLIPLIVWLVLGTICAVIVYNNAKRSRHMNAVPWALIAFLVPLIGLLIYYAIKSSK